MNGFTHIRLLDRQPRSAQRFGTAEVETEEVAAVVVGHQPHILIPVEMS